MNLHHLVHFPRWPHKRISTEMWHTASRIYQLLRFIDLAVKCYLVKFPKTINKEVVDAARHIQFYFMGVPKRKLSIVPWSWMETFRVAFIQGLDVCCYEAKVMCAKTETFWPKSPHAYVRKVRYKLCLKLELYYIVSEEVMKLATCLANFGLAPTGTNSFTNMSLSTSTTYVYSRPVTSSHPIMIYFDQQGCPNLTFRGSVSEGLYLINPILRS